MSNFLSAAILATLSTSMSATMSTSMSATMSATIWFRAKAENLREVGEAFEGGSTATGGESVQELEAITNLKIVLLQKRQSAVEVEPDAFQDFQPVLGVGGC